jgi:hypothetical protein
MSMPIRGRSRTGGPAPKRLEADPQQVLRRGALRSFAGLLAGLLAGLWAGPGLARDATGAAPQGSGPDQGGSGTPSPLPGRKLAGGLREISWDDLIPDDWDPAKQLPFQDVDQISDDDPRSVALMNALRELWDKAPTRSELDGLRIRIPGYVVPLDMLGGRIREFLLVPYFGACIHTPPPPANQILQVRLKTRRDLQTMDAIWVNGRLHVLRAETSMGVSGYLLEAEAVEPYRETGGR